MRYTDGVTPTKYTFTGQYDYMGDFGLMFFNARWVDPALGRFAQADSIVPGPGNPQAWDRYSYSFNNPVRYTDPSGHWTDDQLEDTLGEDWYEKYFGPSGVFKNRKELEKLLRGNATDPITLKIIWAFFEVAGASGLDFSDIDALGAKINLSGGFIGFGGGALEVILNLRSGEFSVYGSLEGGVALGETITFVGGITMFKRLPSNNDYQGVAKAVGIMGGDIIGLNVEGFAGGIHQFQSPHDVMEGGFVGIGGAVPGVAVTGSLSYAWELLRVDSAGYSAFLNRPTLHDIFYETGEVLQNDVFDFREFK